MYRPRRFGLFHLQSLLVMSLLPLTAPAQAASAADDWPAAQAIKLIVPFPQGGPTDVVARVIARQAAGELGQNIVVENLAGAGGTLGVAEAAAARPDGYTLLLTTTSTHAVSPHLFKAFSYDVKKDFTPIAHLGSAGSVLLVAPQLPVQNLKELISHAQANPGKLGYGTSGSGTIVHLISEAFASSANIKMMHLSYRGTGPAREDLKKGLVHVLMDALPTGAPLVQSGELKALAVTTRERSPLLPDVPTLAEAGLPGLDFTTWFGLYTPAGLAEAHQSQLHQAFTRAIQNSDTVLRLRELGVTPPEAHTPEEFASMVEADSARWKKVIDASGISVQ